MKAIKKFFQSEVNKNVIKVFSGTALGQLIAFIAIPVVTRLYSQESLGFYQLFLSTITTFSVVSALRYELAIVLPKNDKDGRTVAALSGLIVLIFSLLLTLVLMIFGQAVFDFLNAPELYEYIILVALGTFTMGFWQVLQYVLIRDKKYGLLSKNRVFQIILTQVLFITFGYINPEPVLLFIAQISGTVVAIISIILKTLYVWKDINFKEIQIKFREYIKFPLINTPTVFLNTLSSQLPIFMLAKFFNADVIGLFMVANRLINAPFKILGKSVSQVYIQNASDAWSDNRKSLIYVYNSAVKKLSLIALVPFIALLFLSPLIVDLMLEDKWSDAALFMQILSFIVIAQFIISPVSTTFSIINKQEAAFVLTIFSLIIRIAVMYFYKEDPFEMITAYVVAGCVFYLVYHLLTIHLIKKVNTYE